WQGVLVIAAADSEAALRAEAVFAGHLSAFDYAALSLIGRDAPLVTMRLAHRQAPEADELELLLAAAGLGAAASDSDGPAVMEFADASRRVAKRARIEAQRLVAFAFFGEVAAAGWLREAMLAGDPLDGYRRYLFAPLAQPPVARPSRGRVLCNCLDVAEADIAQAVADGADSLDVLKERLGAGTRCGGCLPELRRRFEQLAATV
ncbi:MAG TPA: (2Fe-2S)-binding protein, partial [Rhodocyclaceae bacterium]